MISRKQGRTPKSWTAGVQTWHEASQESGEIQDWNRWWCKSIPRIPFPSSKVYPPQDWKGDTSLKRSTSQRSICLSIRPFYIYPIYMNLSLCKLCKPKSIYVWLRYMDYHLDSSGFRTRGNLEWHSQTLVENTWKYSVETGCQVDAGAAVPCT